MPGWGCPCALSSGPTSPSPNSLHATDPHACFVSPWPTNTSLAVGIRPELPAWGGGSGETTWPCLTWGGERAPCPVLASEARTASLEGTDVAPWGWRTSGFCGWRSIWAGVEGGHKGSCARGAETPPPPPAWASAVWSLGPTSRAGTVPGKW